MSATSEMFKAHEHGNGNNTTLTSLVIGFDGVKDEYQPAIDSLQASGSDVVLYEYPTDVLLSGDGHLLPTLAGSMSDDFQKRAAGFAQLRHSGVSVGAGIAIRMQRDTVDPLPGLYAATGSDGAELIMHGKRFRGLVKWFHHINIREQFEANNWDEDRLRTEWADMHQPPTSGAVIAVGGLLDYAVPPGQVRSNVKAWQKEGLPITLIERPHHGHSGIKRWFIGNILEMIKAAEDLKVPNE
jgi:hypothetical protein